MIPYSTCMRFNHQTVRRHSLENENKKYSPCEWTLVQHFGHNKRVESTIITNVTSQDDQTLCFTWTIENDAQQNLLMVDDIPVNPLLISSKERSQSDELDRRSVYLLLALRRRKSLQQSIHPETIPLLDPYYNGISKRFLRNSYQWNFNTFSFDVLTSGHSLSSLLLFLFKEYRFIEIFNLDLINVLRCFNYLEKGYHDTNPYHNSVHAADVTQAMHCFLQETKIKQYLTPMEAMCSILAAVSHDLDHPGVNQQFLIATNSHLTTMHNNLSVLESHHWRFALSCFYESQIFNHFDEKQWKEIKFLLKQLILATDVSRQNEYIQQFKTHIKNGEQFTLEKKEHRHFILQIALKCADLGNPCRPWKTSLRWSEQICNEFYRQGDFEKLLGIPITPMFDRNSMTIAKIQTDFFKNIVRPLFELWNTYLDSKLTKQLINNLNFNEYMWQIMENKNYGRDRLELMKIKRCQSMVLYDYNYNKEIDKIKLSLGNKAINKLIRCKSSDKLSLSSIELIDINEMIEKFKNEHIEMPKTKCINGCGTPPERSSSKEMILDNQVNEDENMELAISDHDNDENDDFISEFNCGAILSTPALILPNFCYEKPQSGFYRRGSAPGCIDIVRRSEKNTAKGTALLLLCNTLKAKNNMNIINLSNNDANNDVKRRSSFPNVKISKASLYLRTSLQYQHLHHQSTNMSTVLNNNNSNNNTAKGKFNRNRRIFQQYSLHQSESCYYGQRSSLFDVSCDNNNNSNQTTAESSNNCHHPYLINNKQYHHHHHNHHLHSNQRRRSVPQDILIRSLNDYYTLQ